ncbi:hypothetical protein BGX21_008359 [Mortierella sp. AD011]|nr:hypothetical protein BGX20_008560 [Mortierella sp. AD010]KAF9397915.1 hypothetical protein BGX21_008359 [Mortierella sp. AD011]
MASLKKSKRDVPTEQPTQVPKKKKALVASSQQQQSPTTDFDCDGIRLPRNADTIGNRIKTAAVNLVPDIKILTPKKRRTLSLGLNSILDLTDLSEGGQLTSVFHQAEEQAALKQRFHPLKRLSNRGRSRKIPSSLPEDISLHWDLVCRLALSDGLSKARSYLAKQMANATESRVNDLTFLWVMVDTMISYPNLFSPDGSEGTSSETDLLSGLWRPLLARVLIDSPAKLRLKTGETTMDSANKEKQEMFEDPNAVSFKIDGRVILDFKGQEYTLCVMEVARSPQLGKVHSDGAKVLREAKNVVNSLVQILPDDKDLLYNSTAFGIQTTGISGCIFSLHLVAPSLYVAVPEASFELPTSITTLPKFKSVINALYELRDNLNYAGSLVRDHLTKRKTLADQLELIEKEEGLQRRAWANGSWYTPPQAAKNKIYIKKDLAAPITFNKRIAMIEDEKAAELASSRFQGTVFDSDGWGIVRNDVGKLCYYNIFINQYVEELGGRRADQEIEDK